MAVRRFWSGGTGKRLWTRRTQPFFCSDSSAVRIRKASNKFVILVEDVFFILKRHPSEESERTRFLWKAMHFFLNLDYMSGSFSGRKRKEEYTLIKTTSRFVRWLKARQSGCGTRRRCRRMPRQRAASSPSATRSPRATRLPRCCVDPRVGVGGWGSEMGWLTKF